MAAEASGYGDNIQCSLSTGGKIYPLSTLVVVSVRMGIHDKVPSCIVDTRPVA